MNCAKNPLANPVQQVAAILTITNNSTSAATANLIVGSQTMADNIFAPNSTASVTFSVYSPSTESFTVNYPSAAYPASFTYTFGNAAGTNTISGNPTISGQFTSAAVTF